MTASGARHLIRAPMMLSEEGPPGWYPSLLPKRIWVRWEAGSTYPLGDNTRRDPGWSPGHLLLSS